MGFFGKEPTMVESYKRKEPGNGRNGDLENPTMAKGKEK